MLPASAEVIELWRLPPDGQTRFLDEIRPLIEKHRRDTDESTEGIVRQWRAARRVGCWRDKPTISINHATETNGAPSTGRVWYRAATGIALLLSPANPEEEIHRRDARLLEIARQSEEDDRQERHRNAEEDRERKHHETLAVAWRAMSSTTRGLLRMVPTLDKKTREFVIACARSIAFDERMPVDLDGERMPDAIRDALGLPDFIPEPLPPLYSALEKK